MLSKILSCALNGIDGYVVEVETDIGNGLPAFEIVGLPDSAVKESKERVRTSIKNSGLQFPVKRITINLAPADIKKEGPGFDLPIAVGILACIGIIPVEMVEDVFIAGELSLDGSLRAINGVLPMVHTVYNKGIKKCIVPYQNADEASLVKDMTVYPAKNLNEIIEHFRETNEIQPYVTDIDNIIKSSEASNDVDFADVKGQESVKRALEIAAAGYHNILMVGPPGSGKTMMSKRLPTILPDLTFEESIEITKIYSVAGLIKDKSCLITKRPFRAPHHTASSAALTGGGRNPKPGEISLSCNGVLFLDEFPEFNRNVLEVLRQPLEEGVITVSRVNATVTYPARFMLLAAMNPCPCGYLGTNRCKCSPREISRYSHKISGPLIDRIDIQIETPPVRYNDLDISKRQETSAEIKKRVVAAHNIQRERYKNENISFNSQLTAPQIEKYCSIGKAEKRLMEKAFNSLELSARSYHKILKIARTVADIEGKEKISEKHIGEVLQYRSLDRKFFSV